MGSFIALSSQSVELFITVIALFISGNPSCLQPTLMLIKLPHFLICVCMVYLPTCSSSLLALSHFICPFLTNWGFMNQCASSMRLSCICFFKKCNSCFGLHHLIWLHPCLFSNTVIWLCVSVSPGHTLLPVLSDRDHDTAIKPSGS